MSTEMAERTAEHHDLIGIIRNAIAGEFMALTPLDTRLSDAISAIYMAATAPVLWSETLEKIAAVSGDIGANLLYIWDDGSFGIVVAPSLQVATEEYNREWWKHDIRTQRAIEYGYAAGVEAIADRHVVPEREIAEHPFYTGFLRPHGVGWFAGVAITPDPRIVLALTVHRSMAEKAPFSDEELSVMTRIGRVCEHALRLSAHLLTAEMTNLAFGDALARLEAGVYLLDEMGRVSVADRDPFDQPFATGVIGVELQFGILPDENVDSSQDVQEGVPSFANHGPTS